MTFEIQFVTNRNSKYAINIDYQCGGIKLLDLVREELDVKLPIKLFSNYVDSLVRSPGIEISESLARECGLFKNRPSIQVKVNDGQFNKFTYITFIADRNKETGEIRGARCKRVIDEGAIIDAWKQAGFPTDWTLVKVEE